MIAHLWVADVAVLVVVILEVDMILLVAVSAVVHTAVVAVADVLLIVAVIAGLQIVLQVGQVIVPNGHLLIDQAMHLLQVVRLIDHSKAARIAIQNALHGVRLIVAATEPVVLHEVVVSVDDLLIAAQTAAA